MEISMSTIALFLATLLAGLAAGLCFTWTNAVTTGIGQLDDLGYLKSFQQMNRTILNPLFFLIFFGPFFIAALAAVLNRSGSPQVFWLLLIAAGIYFVGVAMVTVFGNVPLNEVLDKTDLATASLEDLKTLRNRFEGRWNRLHLIRTITSAISFGMLLLTSFIK